MRAVLDDVRRVALVLVGMALAVLVFRLDVELSALAVGALAVVVLRAVARHGARRWRRSRRGHWSRVSGDQRVP